MNEQLQNALAGIIEKATTGIDAATGFLAAELPDVIYQLLLWYAAKGAITSVAGAALLFAAYKLTKLSVKKVQEREWDELALLPVFLTGVPAVVFGFAGLAEIMDTLQILIAPKIWLLEYAAALAK